MCNDPQLQRKPYRTFAGHKADTARTLIGPTSDTGRRLGRRLGFPKGLASRCQGEWCLNRMFGEGWTGAPGVGSFR